MVQPAAEVKRTRPVSAAKNLEKLQRRQASQFCAIVYRIIIGFMQVK